MFKHPLNTFTGYSSFVWCAQIIGGRDHPQLATHQPPPGSVTTTIELTFSDFILINFYLLKQMVQMVGLFPHYLFSLCPKVRVLQSKVSDSDKKINSPSSPKYFGRRASGNHGTGEMMAAWWWWWQDAAGALFRDNNHTANIVTTHCQNTLIVSAGPLCWSVRVQAAADGDIWYLRIRGGAGRGTGPGIQGRHSNNNADAA